MTEQQEFEKRMAEYIDRQNRPTVKFKKLHDDAKIPEYQTEGSVGFDFYCIEDFEIHPTETVIIRTGLSCEIPKGYFLAIVPRSSTGVKTPLRLSNSLGVIDQDYRGEIGLIFTHYGISGLKVKVGDRLAQGLILPVKQARIEQIEELSVTERGEGGFGSTGK